MATLFFDTIFKFIAKAHSPKCIPSKKIWTKNEPFLFDGAINVTTDLGSTILTNKSVFPNLAYFIPVPFFQGTPRQIYNWRKWLNIYFFRLSHKISTRFLHQLKLIGFLQVLRNANMADFIKAIYTLISYFQCSFQAFLFLESRKLLVRVQI